MPVKPNTKARLFDSTGHVADTAVLSANVTPSKSPALLEITTAVNASTAVDLVDFDGTTEFNHTLNDGNAIGSEELFTTTVPANATSEYNVQYRQDVDVHLLQIDEKSL